MEQNVITMILKNGKPTGIIQCNVVDWIGISYKIPRNKLNEVKELNHISNTGVYMLMGIDEKTGQEKIYIGEAENIYTRLVQHNKAKDFWKECLVFVSQDNSLNKAHIKFIENQLYIKAKEVERFKVENESKPTKSSLDAADEIRAIRFYEKILLLTSICGYRTFDEMIERVEEVKENNILYLTVNKVQYAKGMMTDEGFVVLKDSKIKDDISDGISPSLLKFVQRERASDDINNGIYIRNHLYSTPSMAAVAVLGRNSNGYNEWKDCEGKKLKEIVERKVK